ncbi:cysteine-binding protein FliY, putative [Talaromyces stipitatus ATCC 10500]|uniref:Cysteine-binding protein FliY, putative n=1 Tax=Talaromyces stipitatus (strain ATCC 10500 / CBS 375.48 / QM 6759 / NRRL 1006) TaxID=441959 RepID=B8LY94_TALSN|nr:cysteine-binding protein FliY, putative [Talaromyces stipitatus ATCC 10500]EED23339.1 cysteine-binding protein FliY, putative [Talaromyces stipitatus ATCC 10500]
MVGVPRSKGCSVCRNRRIKCDEARPECGQCQKYGCPCPGYNRGLKFQDEGPNLQRRHRRLSDRKSSNNDVEKKPSSDSNSSNSSSKADPRAMMPEVVAEDALLLMQTHVSSIDESLSPSLMQKLFMTQQPRLFMDFTCAAFPTLYFHNRFRSQIAFPEYIMENFHSRAYQDSAVCCLSAVYLASLTKDSRLLRSSRYMYGEALRRINRIIDTDEALSDNVLSTVMMLMIYELYARTTPDAWVKHARGVKEMMVKRGVKKHMSGFGRSCYYAFRGFLVAHALHEGIPCFLDDEEWQNFAAQVQQEDAKKPGEWSVFVHISEMIFMELVKCPRYVYDVRQLSPTTPRNVIMNLVARIRATCANLRSLSDELQASIMYHFQKKQGIEVNVNGFVGPAPSLFPDTNPTLLLQGATHCINTLEKVLGTIKIDNLAIQLAVGATPEVQAHTSPQSQSQSPPRLPSSPPSATYSHEVSGTDYLSPTPSADSTCETISSNNSSPRGPADDIPSTANPIKTHTFTLPFRLVSEISRGPVHHDKSSGGHRSVVWLDHIACSMGMIRTDVEAEAVPEEEEYNNNTRLETIPESVEIVEDE